MEWKPVWFLCKFLLFKKKKGVAIKPTHTLINPLLNEWNRPDWISQCFWLYCKVRVQPTIQSTVGVMWFCLLWSSKTLSGEAPALLLRGSALKSLLRTKDMNCHGVAFVLCISVSSQLSVKGITMEYVSCDVAVSVSR